MLRAVALIAAATTAGLVVDPAPPETTEPLPALFHPHFPKKLEVTLPRMETGLPEPVSIVVRYQTATYNPKRDQAAKVGAVFHLAGARITTSAALNFGGQDVPAGSYTIRGRKTEGGAWELAIDQGRPFSETLTEKAMVLKTIYDGKAPLFEHLNIDIQPSGSKQQSKLYLDVRIGTKLARCEILLKNK